MKRTVLAFLVVLVLVPALTPMMLVRAPAGLLLDLTTQKGGTGIGEPSPPFTPAEVVELRTRLTFNDVPQENILVGFEVQDPNNETVIVRTQLTDDNGVATIEFRIPISPCRLGTWTAFAISEVKGLTALDTLHFEVVIVCVTTIESCDIAGAEKNVFDLSEFVYACGANYSAQESVIIYVVPNGGPYTASASVASQPAQADTSGYLGPVNLGAFHLGEYDIWVDREPYDGELDTETEPLDAFCSIAGFFVIPEYVIGSLLGLVACFAAFAGFIRFKSIHQIRRRTHANLSGSHLFLAPPERVYMCAL